MLSVVFGGILSRRVICINTNSGLQLASCYYVAPHLTLFGTQMPWMVELHLVLGSSLTFFRSSQQRYRLHLCPRWHVVALPLGVPFVPVGCRTMVDGFEHFRYSIVVRFCQCLRLELQALPHRSGSSSGTYSIYTTRRVTGPNKTATALVVQWHRDTLEPTESRHPICRPTDNVNVLARVLHFIRLTAAHQIISCHVHCISASGEGLNKNKAIISVLHLINWTQNCTTCCCMSS